MNTAPKQLSQEAARATEALAGKIVARIERHRASEVLIEFTDGSRLFVDGTNPGLELSVTGGCEPNRQPTYEEVVMCEGSQEEGVIHIKVVALPYQDPVEFNTAEAREIVETIVRAIDHVEAGWAGGSKGGS